MKIFRIAIDPKSDEFKDWFGNWEANERNPFSSINKEPLPSHAIKDGVPQVFYHGTTEDDDFEDFELGRETVNSWAFGHFKTTRHAIFFTPLPSDADAFTSSEGEFYGGNIKPIYLNIRSPLILTSERYIHEDMLQEFREEGIHPRKILHFGWGQLDGEEGKRFVDVAKKLGYDGIIFNEENPDTGNEMETWAVFDPSQIKSIYE